MTVAKPAFKLGRPVFGVAALATGLVTLAWHYHSDHAQLRGGFVTIAGAGVVYAAAGAQVLGGAAIIFPRSAKAGAVLLGSVYLVLALQYVPRIVASPQIYDRWGNFFEQFSLATGGAIVYGCLSAAWAPEANKRIGRMLFGICVASFTLEQAIYLNATASLVPKWLPPSQMFWAVTTTAAFALAAAALVTNRMALTAIRLLTLMLATFGILVWMPLLLSDPHSHANWSETAETFAIAGAAWILADLLGEKRPEDPSPATGGCHTSLEV